MPTIGLRTPAIESCPLASPIAKIPLPVQLVANFSCSHGCITSMHVLHKFLPLLWKMFDSCILTILAQWPPLFCKSFPWLCSWIMDLHWWKFFLIWKVLRRWVAWGQVDMHGKVTIGKGYIWVRPKCLGEVWEWPSLVVSNPNACLGELGEWPSFEWISVFV